tara:strand:- start:1513 stop:2382 length:870 start_codon:yes stop_codon:yes gene_type:complete
MLNEEQRAQLVEASKSLSLVEEPPSDTLRVDATTGTESGGEVVEDVKLEKSVKVESETEERVEVDTSTEETDDSPPKQRGHNVPYSRFKNVLDGRNKFRSEAESYKTQLSSLEQKLANLEQSKIEPPVQQAQVEDNNWLDDFLAEDTETQTPDWQGKYQGLDKRLYKFEVAQEEKSLKAELGSIKEQYPGVPEQFLLQAVIKDPNVDMTKIAGDYHSFISGIEEQAIARYSEGQAVSVETVPAPEAPPRPKSVGTSPAKVMAKPDKRPSTIEEASASLRNLLKKDNPFR